MLNNYREKIPPDGGHNDGGNKRVYLSDVQQDILPWNVDASLLPSSAKMEQSSCDRNASELRVTRQKTGFTDISILDSEKVYEQKSAHCNCAPTQHNSCVQKVIITCSVTKSKSGGKKEIVSK